MLLYARLVPGHEKNARRIAENAARYLIGISEPAGSPLEFFPPTYDSGHIDTTRQYPGDIDMPWAAKTSRENQGVIMLIYPASVVPAYLKLFNDTRDSIYFNAAYRIAATYAKIQLPDGRWPLLMDRKTGNATVRNFANTGVILGMFEKMKDQYNIVDFDDVIKKARKIWKDPYEHFDFEGQFEDIPPSERYKNLANYPALQAARHYFKLSDDHPGYLDKAKTFLNFAEDQFVVWEKPIPKPRPDKEEYSKGWIVPAALEQYECYRPIDAHVAAFISIYELAYQKTQEKIFLAKAISLANSMTIAQDARTGRIPTWWLPAWLNAPGWLNCAVGDAEVMNEFGNQISKLKIKY
jgi:maltose/maltodextrin transport system substrate-binding protein